MSDEIKCGAPQLGHIPPLVFPVCNPTQILSPVYTEDMEKVAEKYAKKIALDCYVATIKCLFPDRPNPKTVLPSLKQALTESTAPLIRKIEELAVELGKWKDACELNARNCNDARIDNHKLQSQIEVNSKFTKDLLSTAEMLMGVVCNSSGGNWNKESKDWQLAARKTVDEYYKLLYEMKKIATESNSTSQARIKELEAHLSDANKGARINAQINQSLTNKNQELEAMVVKKDEALKSAQPYLEECLIMHDGSLGRATKKNKRHAELIEQDIIKIDKALTTNGNELGERLKKLELDLQSAKDTINIYEGGQRLDSIVAKLAEGAADKISDKLSTAMKLLVRAEKTLVAITASGHAMCDKEKRHNGEAIKLANEADCLHNETLTHIETFLKENSKLKD